MSGQSFSAYLWNQASYVWEAVSEHPFLSELQDGTLPVEKFRYYILQDYLYLGGFGRAAAAALAQAPDTESAVRLLKRVTTPVERPLHGALFDALGVSEEEAEASSPSPTNLAYMNHIEVSMDMGGLACGVAALLPCPRIYHEVGKILDRARASRLQDMAVNLRRGLARSQRRSLVGVRGRTRRRCRPGHSRIDGRSISHQFAL